MKKLLYAGGLLFIIGAIMLTIVSTMNPINWNRVLNVVNKSPFINIGENYDENYVSSHDKYNYDSITSMDLELAIADVKVVAGNEFSVDVKEGCGMEVNVSMDHGKLTVKDVQRSVCINGMGSKITIVIPEGTIIDDADIEVALGNLEIKNIQANELSIVANLGNVDMHQTYAKSADIKLAMGDLSFSGDISEEADISNSMGKVTLELFGNETNYAFNISNSMGSVRVGNNKYDSFNNSFKVNEQAPIEIEVDNSMGDIVIQFR